MTTRLTQKQFDILKLLFRFRYATSGHLAIAQGGLSKQAINIRLASLEDKGLVVKHRDGRARIEGRPATYRLNAEGIAVLRQAGVKYSPKVLESIRLNTNPSGHFLSHNLTLFSIFNRLNADYEKGLVFLTKSNMAAGKFNYLPKSRPDGFIKIEGASEHYFLYLLNDTSPYFTHINQLKRLLEYERSGMWELEDFPIILLVCTSKTLETMVCRHFSKLISNRYSKIKFATSTIDRLLLGDNKESWLTLDIVKPVNLLEIQ
jgi:DNA-binding transcriptional ArsR family regulator